MAPFLAGIALVSTAPVPATAAAFEDWPTFLHDTARSGASGEAILNTANATLLKKRFSYLTGGLIAPSLALVPGASPLAYRCGEALPASPPPSARNSRPHLPPTT